MVVVMMKRSWRLKLYMLDMEKVVVFQRMSASILICYVKNPRLAMISCLRVFDDIMENSGHKTTYDVAIFVSDSWKKEELEDGAGSDSETEMVCWYQVQSQPMSFLRKQS